MRTSHFLFSRTVQMLALLAGLILISSSLFSPTQSAGITSTAVAPAPGPQPSPQNVGQWSSVIEMPIVAIHMHLLPNGKILIWQDDDHEDYDTNETRAAGSTVAYVWEVGTGFTQVNNTTRNVFCSAHSFLPDGRLLIAGGHDGLDHDGIDDTFIFNFANNTWTQTSEPMDVGRWYPSTLTLGNGEVVVVAGRDRLSGVSFVVETPEVWRTNSGGGWQPLTGAELNLEMYPYLHLAPNGKVFVSGVENTTRYLDTSGSGAWTTVGGDRSGGRIDYGASVMYDVGKVVVMGGDPPDDSAEVIDLNQTTPDWSSVDSMEYARRHLNATILPDGKVLVTGGTSTGPNNESGAVYAAEMWNPATGNFSTMASMQTPRLYHSTAILLPDGRVVTAGGGRGGGAEHEFRNAEIYSPPYLFTTGGAAATRPTIDSHLSKGVRPGQTIFVTTPDAASISKVTLVALSSNTHSRNMSQRFNNLSFTPRMGGLDVTMPPNEANAWHCPPGPYMLFILNSNGVPSVAQFINVKSSHAEPGAPSALDGEATYDSGSGTFSNALSWSAPTTGSTVDHYEIQRSTNGFGSITTISTTSTSYTDGTFSGSSVTTYAYRVRAVDAQGNYSNFSNVDIATTIVFTDDPLSAGTLILADHMIELRQAVNAVRAAAGLSAVSWTNNTPPTLVGVEVKAAHINELRSNLDAALGLFGLPTGSYTDSSTPPAVTLPANTPIRAVHWQQLRDRVK